MAEATERIELGSAIACAFGRTPWCSPPRRATWTSSGGRFTLGLGTGTRRMQQDWHGLDGEHPASRMEELVPLLRRLWKLHEGPIEHEGRFYRLDAAHRSAAAAAARGDPGVHGRRQPPHDRGCGQGGGRARRPPVVHPGIRQRGGGPALDGTPIAGYITTSVSGDRDQARHDAAAIIAFNSTVKTYRAVHRVRVRGAGRGRA